MGTAFEQYKTKDPYSFKGAGKKVIHKNDNIDPEGKGYYKPKQVGTDGSIFDPKKKKRRDMIFKEVRGK